MKIDLKQIKNQTEEICLVAVEQDGNALYYVKEQTEKICLKAAKENFIALEQIKDKNLKYKIIKKLQNENKI